MRSIGELNDLIELVRNDPDAPGGMASKTH